MCLLYTYQLYIHIIQDHIDQWDADRVYQWLSTVENGELQQLAQKFRHERIKGKVLDSVTDSQLTEMGVKWGDKLLFNKVREVLFLKYNYHSTYIHHTPHRMIEPRDSNQSNRSSHDTNHSLGGSSHHINSPNNIRPTQSSAGKTPYGGTPRHIGHPQPPQPPSSHLPHQISRITRLTPQQPIQQQLPTNRYPPSVVQQMPPGQYPKYTYSEVIYTRKSRNGLYGQH